MNRISSYIVAALLGAATLAGAAPKPVTLLNVSYDPTREFYVEFNAAFAAHWEAKTGQKITINQSHGGAGKQAETLWNGMVTWGRAGAAGELQQDQLAAQQFAFLGGPWETHAQETEKANTAVTQALP